MVDSHQRVDVQRSTGEKANHSCIFSVRWRRLQILLNKIEFTIVCYVFVRSGSSRKSRDHLFFSSCRSINVLCCRLLLRDDLADETLLQQISETVRSWRRMRVQGRHVCLEYRKRSGEESDVLAENDQRRKTISILSWKTDGRICAIL